ncbi:MAG: MBL fold metallo-hydrolase [Corynebacterium sp.]|nr:MBL fold metallo-hydrolase [Corynebacterium sp.]
MEIFGFATGPYKTNCYVLLQDQKATIIDPGMHAAEQLIEYFTEHSIEPEQILLTHGHIDHTRDAGILAAHYRIPVYIHEADAFMLTDGSGVSPESLLLFDTKNMTPITDLRFYQHEDTVTAGETELRIKHAPGHSPGCVMLVGDSFVFSGDVLFKGSIGRTDLVNSSPEDMEASLQKQVMSLSDDLQVLPGHGPVSTVRAEKRSNPFLVQFA